MKNRFKSLSFGAVLLAGAALLSKILGVIRDMVIAYVFGAGESEGLYALDSYFAAFRIPDLIYTFLVAGAMSAAFVPIYTQLKKKSQKGASEFASKVIHLVLVLLVLVSALMYLLAPYFVPLLTPGFSESLQVQTTSLTRVMLLSPFFLGLSSIFQGIENSHKSFWGIALAPIVYNLSLILGAYFFGREYGVYALTWAVVLGAVLHFLVQCPSVISTPFKYRWLWDFKTKDIKDFIRLTIPRLFGIGFIQMTVVVDTLLASLLAVGSLSVYNYALNLQSLPHSVVAVSVSIAVFSSLSEFDDAPEKFKETVKNSLNAILFWVLPAILGLFLLRNEIVELLLMRGSFEETAVARTAGVLGVFVWAALGQSLVPLLARAFYALKDTKTPVVIVFISGLTQILLSLVMVLIYGLPVWSLALAAIIGASLNAGLLLWILAKRLNLKIQDLFLKEIKWTLHHLFLMGLLVCLLQILNYPSLIIELSLIIPIAGISYLGLHKLSRTIPRSL